MMRLVLRGITFDFDSIDDKQVTVRDRDTLEQKRVAIDQLSAYLSDTLASGTDQKHSRG